MSLEAKRVALANYLPAKYDIGERTKHKCDPSQVSTDMRKALAESGERLFDQSEWLTKTQVKGFFSRLTASRRKKQSQAQDKEMLEPQVTDDSGEDDENEEEDEDEDEYDDEDSTEDDMHHEEIVQGIIDEVALARPIMYDDVYMTCVHMCEKTNWPSSQYQF